jgi:hypothetical protein
MFQRACKALMPCLYPDPQASADVYQASSASPSNHGRDGQRANSTASPASILRKPTPMSEEDYKQIARQADERLTIAKPEQRQAETLRKNWIFTMIAVLKLPTEGEVSAFEQESNQKMYAHLKEVHGKRIDQLTEQEKTQMRWDIGFYQQQQPGFANPPQGSRARVHSDEASLDDRLVTAQTQTISTGLAKPRTDTDSSDDEGGGYGSLNAFSQRVTQDPRVAHKPADHPLNETKVTTV